VRHSLAGVVYRGLQISRIAADLVALEIGIAQVAKERRTVLLNRSGDQQPLRLGAQLDGAVHVVAIPSAEVPLEDKRGQHVKQVWTVRRCVGLQLFGLLNQVKRALQVRSLQRASIA
jgi:hypothetical protein